MPCKERFRVAGWTAVATALLLERMHRSHRVHLRNGLKVGPNYKGATACMSRIIDVRRHRRANPPGARRSRPMVDRIPGSRA